MIDFHEIGIAYTFQSMGQAQETKKGKLLYAPPVFNISP